jgi:hypothetical protein
MMMMMMMNAWMMNLSMTNQFQWMFVVGLIPFQVEDHVVVS